MKKYTQIHDEDSQRNWEKYTKVTSFTFLDNNTQAKGKGQTPGL